MELRNLHFVLAASALMLLFGCSSQPKPESVTPETDLASQSVDEQFVAVAKVFPGFAGLFYKDDGGLVLNVAPPPGSSVRASFMLTDALEDKVLAAVLDLLYEDLLILWTLTEPVFMA